MGWSIVTSILLKVARKVLEGVIAKLLTQNKLVEGLTDQLSKYLTDLLVVWEGDDAQEFVEQVKREFVPELQKLGMGIAGLGTNITSAQDTLVKADTNNTRVVQEIRNSFAKVQW